jgi:hypothetical protein
MGSRPRALAMLEHAIDDGLTGLVGLFGHNQQAFSCAVCQPPISLEANYTLGTQNLPVLSGRQ